MADLVSVRDRPIGRRGWVRYVRGPGRQLCGNWPAFVDDSAVVCEQGLDVSHAKKTKRQKKTSDEKLFAASSGSHFSP